MRKDYSVILGNLGNTCDRFCSSYKTNPDTWDMLKSAAAIPHVSGIELVGTWDIRPDNMKQMKSALQDLNLKCVSIIPDLFANPVFWKGAYSSKEVTVRQTAMDYSRQMADIALELDCSVLNIWPGQDGYDYLLTADYAQEREWECDAMRQLAMEYPQISWALEYKPKEPRTHSYMARMADTLLLAQETGCKNVGITIDTGHAFVAGEVVAESIVLAQRGGNKLMHMHFNDNYASWDDDMIVGTVHSIAYIEMLYWLDRTQYSGWLSMDQYPYREDAAGAIGESIAWVVRYQEVMEAHKAEIDELLKLGDPVVTSRFLRKVLLG